MKRLFLFCTLACFFTNIYPQTIFTYGNNAVSKDEFLRAYNKNKTAVTDKTLALKEYLDLYIRFKLKVKAAQDLRIDTLASLANDLQNFRTQIEEGYLNDESRLNALTQEAFLRSQKDIHASYVFYPLKEFPDTNALTKKSSVVNPAWNDVGFITVFSLPYVFENIVYSLQPGEQSKPYRGKTGYYIFKNIEERKAVGKVKAAQILIAVPEDGRTEDRLAAQKLSDSIYHAIQAGADFGEMAKQFSNDKMTYTSGGLMPEFGVGKYDPVFENRVFALQKNEDISQPFATKFGYHIVKRIAVTAVPQDKNNDTYLYALKQQIMQDDRIASAKEKFVNGVLKKLQYKKNTVVKEDALWKYTDSNAVNKKIIVPNVNDNTVLFSFDNAKIKVSDWLAFIKEYKASGNYKNEGNKELMNRFIATTALENYRKRLALFNPDFRYQMQEFKDGNMLFEVMERNVWTKASNDSTGLKKYYTEHKTKYTWTESADAVIISCTNEKIANEAAQKIKNGKSWKQIAEENTSQIQTDSGRYELNQIPAKPNTHFTSGMVTEPLVNTADFTATFAKIITVYPPNRQRSFDEARGLVINDYQSFLEEKWIEQLKKKYPVKINEAVFKSTL